MLNLFNLVISPGYDQNTGYRIKIKLICRLTKDRDEVLISISTEFPAQLILLFFKQLRTARARYRMGI